MRVSDFRLLVAHEFGDAYGPVVTSQQVMHELGERTADDALAAGVDPAVVWRALCRAMDVPRERWLGPVLPPKPGTPV